jgi:hypothetical protein
LLQPTWRLKAAARGTVINTCEGKPRYYISTVSSNFCAIM